MKTLADFDRLQEEQAMLLKQLPRKPGTDKWNQVAVALRRVYRELDQVLTAELPAEER